MRLHLTHTTAILLLGLGIPACTVLSPTSQQTQVRTGADIPIRLQIGGFAVKAPIVLPEGSPGVSFDQIDSFRFTLLESDGVTPVSGTERLVSASTLPLTYQGAPTGSAYWLRVEALNSTGDLLNAGGNPCLSTNQADVGVAPGYALGFSSGTAFDVPLALANGSAYTTDRSATVTITPSTSLFASPTHYTVSCLNNATGLIFQSAVLPLPGTPITLRTFSRGATSGPTHDVWVNQVDPAATPKLASIAKPFYSAASGTGTIGNVTATIANTPLENVGSTARIVSGGLIAIDKDDQPCFFDGNGIKRPQSDHPSVLDTLVNKSNVTSFAFDRSGNLFYVTAASNDIYKSPTPGYGDGTIVLTPTGTVDTLTVDEAGNILWMSNNDLMVANRFKNGYLATRPASTGIGPCSKIQTDARGYVYYVNGSTVMCIGTDMATSSSYGTPSAQATASGTILDFTSDRVGNVYFIDSASPHEIRMVPANNNDGTGYAPALSYRVGGTASGSAASDPPATGVPLATDLKNPLNLAISAKGTLYFTSEGATAGARFLRRM